MTPETQLEAGAAILAKFLAGYGFQFRVEETDRGSGGPFARGAFLKGDRRLELHYRWSLGLVSYTVGNTRVAHEDFARARASDGRGVYSGFFSEPLDDFRALLADLEAFGSPFLSGSVEDFLAVAEWVQSHPRPLGLAALDDAARQSR